MGCFCFTPLYIHFERSSVCKSQGKALFIPPFGAVGGVFDDDALRGEFRADGVGAGVVFRRFRFRARVDTGEDVGLA